MTPTTTAFRTGIPLDELDLGDAIIGDRFVLHRLPNRRMLVHALEGGRAYRVGEFDRVSDVWAALDSIDISAHEGPAWNETLAA